MPWFNSSVILSFFLASSTEWFFDFVVFRDIGWNAGHILQNEIACYIMSAISLFLCFWLYQISLLDFINFYIYLSLQKASLFWFSEEFVS